MYCKHCGKSIEDNSKFCSYCGNSLIETEDTFEDYSVDDNNDSVEIVDGFFFKALPFHKKLFLSVLGLILVVCIASVVLTTSFPSASTDLINIFTR